MKNICLQEIASLANCFSFSMPSGVSLTLINNSGIVKAVCAKRINKLQKGKPSHVWGRIGSWLRPGLGIKRWLALIIAGTALIGLGVAILLLDIYRSNPGSPILAFISMAVLPRWLRAILIGGLGLASVLFALFRLNRTLLAPFVKPGEQVVDAVAEHRRLGRGPKIVAVGGGTGLSALLRGLKHYSGNITAVVTVADDGGSSGRLRRSLGLPPPGDLRNCLAALSHDEDLLTKLFQYRFREGEELNGHSFGNLFIAALSGVKGSFERGLLEAGRVLAIRGRVLPSTLGDVALLADKKPEANSPEIRIQGETRITEAPGRIKHMELVPNNPPAYPEAIHAILNADMIIVGPGSLYTSVIPNLLVKDIVEAIRASRAFKVYVCNVATQPGETDGYDSVQHLAAIEDHVGKGLVDLMLANDNFEGAFQERVEWVAPPNSRKINVLVHTADLIDEEHPWRHDPKKLSETLIALLEERTGPLNGSDISLNEQLSGRD